MPRGIPVEWTREMLLAVERASGKEAVTELADAYSVRVPTIYSMKARLKDQGLDGVLRDQEARYLSYERGGAFGSQGPEAQLARIYNLTIAKAGRGGGSSQYTVTIPSSIGAAWVEKWGQQVRFKPTDEGLLIVPVEQPPVPELPAWLTNGAPRKTHKAQRRRDSA